MRKRERVLWDWKGFSARLYFESLKYVLPENIGFRGLRTRRPPQDLFNAAISFGYSYLKHLVDREFWLRGVNPYSGFLHEEADKIKPFLTFDVMEGFRHWFVDKIVIGLINKNLLKVDRHTKRLKNGIHLNKSGIKLLMRKLHEEKKSKFQKLIAEEVKNFINNISAEN